MIKKIQTELIILIFLSINIFLSYNIDIGLYNYFSNFNHSLGAIYLKEFFIGITKLGDSLWYFLIIITSFLISVIFEKTKVLPSMNYQKIKNFCVFGFFYLLSVGLVTQILKHLVGRPRPNYTDLNNSFGFNFFSFDSAFHSFPSGHSSTIISVVIILSLILPSLKILFYIFGFFIAISRVVVGAHFVTDVIAGMVVAIIVYKILLIFVQKRYQNFSLKNYVLKPSLLTKSLIIFLITAIFLTIGFKFDMFFSGIFYYGNNQFFLQSYDFISIIFRKILLPFCIIYIFILPILGRFFSLKKIFFGYKFSLKEILFIWASGIITSIFVVNVLLKNTWGRARPNDILQFGGTNNFTPWYKFSEECLSNCSFVSGDASIGFMLIIFYFLTKKNTYFYLAIISGSTFGFIRIIAGGHFLSDIIFSNIVVVFVVATSFYIFKKNYGK